MQRLTDGAPVVRRPMYAARVVTVQPKMQTFSMTLSGEAGSSSLRGDEQFAIGLKHFSESFEFVEFDGN